MPPKKKQVAKDPKQEVASEILTNREPQKIPKKPLFRCMNYNTLTKAKHMKVKHWKVYSCRLTRFSAETSSFYDYLLGLNTIQKEDFKKTLTQKTIKRSFKYVRKFHYDPEIFPNQHLVHRLLCPSWKLDFLNLYFSKKFDYKTTLKAFLNSKLKDCVIHSNMVEDLDPELVATFRRLRKCNLLVESCVNELCMVLNTDKLIQYQKVAKFVQKRDETQGEFVSNRAIINAPECFEKICYNCWVDPDRGRNPIPHLPSLPSLQTLAFAWRFPPGPDVKRSVDISFVKQYSKLEYLAIRLENCETETLDYLADLPHLKELHFAFRQKDEREGPTLRLPNLTKLEKFGLELSKSSIFTDADVKDFLFKNKNLKSLGLSLSIQHMSAIFEEGDDDFVLSGIEKLRITIHSIEKSYAGAAKTIAKALKRHNFVREFYINIEQCKADLNAFFLKEVIAHMKSLQCLIVGYKMSGGLEDNKFKHLKDVFNNLENLTYLDLSLVHDAIGPREVSSILDSLMKLKHLKKLALRLNLSKPTPGALNKLSEFVTWVRKIPYFEVYFNGISKEDQKEVEDVYLPRVTLWQGTFISPHVETYHI